jgi:hypothetical protein
VLAYTLAFDQFLDSIPEPLLTELPTKRRRTAKYAAAPEAVKLTVDFLEHEFDIRQAASEAFPPEITSSHIRTSVSKYKDEISAASKRSVCCCCGRWATAGDIYKVSEQNNFILSPQGHLNCCSYHRNS